MPLRKHLKTLWHSLFPVKYVLVYRDRQDLMPLAEHDSTGDLVQFDAMLPELQEAYKTCAPMFRWLAWEIARKDKLYHALPPVHDPAAYETWRRTMEGLNAQLAVLNRASRIPAIANNRIIRLKELAESKKATDVERKALEEFFSEESDEK